MKSITLNFKQNKKFIIFSIILILLLVFLDQAIKSYMIVKINNCAMFSCKMLPFLNLTLVLNTGVAFGAFANFNYAFLVIPIAVICITFVLFYLLLKSKSKTESLSYSLIISGAIGNTSDRFIYGGVVDFLDFYFKQWHYPAFNLADILIFIGAFILIFYDIFKKKHHN
jgi:signal peptidase II